MLFFYKDLTLIKKEKTQKCAFSFFGFKKSKHAVRFSVTPRNKDILCHLGFTVYLRVCMLAP